MAAIVRKEPDALPAVPEGPGAPPRKLHCPICLDALLVRGWEVSAGRYMFTEYAIDVICANCGVEIRIKKSGGWRL